MKTPFPEGEGLLLSDLIIRSRGDPEIEEHIAKGPHAKTIRTFIKAEEPRASEDDDNIPRSRKTEQFEEPWVARTLYISLFHPVILSICIPRIREIKKKIIEMLINF